MVFTTGVYHWCLTTDVLPLSSPRYGLSRDCMSWLLVGDLFPSESIPCRPRLWACHCTSSGFDLFFFLNPPSPPTHWRSPLGRRLIRTKTSVACLLLTVRTELANASNRMHLFLLAKYHEQKIPLQTLANGWVMIGWRSHVTWTRIGGIPL